ncbi:ExbD/TolR family protein [Bdellovibrio sp. HCB337]|uniref:ExbD/TolR family protein n=1 Tax=Bdellovibrio sp. HCB337 TaxID=3394358 RepID=UPI0039A6D84A
MKKELNFELNILPVLDILSVLICFLLLTAVWMQLGTIDTKQAIGDNSTAGAKNPPSLWVVLQKDGTVQLSLRDVPQAKNLEDSVAKTAQGVNWNTLESKIQALRNKWPDLKTSIVRPEARASYGDVIRIMDQLKKNQFDGVGLSPLG